MMLSKMDHPLKNFRSFGFQAMCPNLVITGNEVDKMTDVVVAVEGSIYIYDVISNAL